MAKNIPEGITRKDVLEAIAAFSDGSVQHNFHESEKYDLLHDGKRYPPEAILGIAARRSAGHVLEPRDFSGGEGSPCFNVLRGCGFEIVLKPDAGTSEGSDWSDPEIDAAVSAYLGPEGHFRCVTRSPHSAVLVSGNTRGTHDAMHDTSRCRIRN